MIESVLYDLTRLPLGGGGRKSWYIIIIIIIIIISQFVYSQFVYCLRVEKVDMILSS